MAAVSSAHMLGWLNIAFGMQIEVLSYLDRAHGVLTGSTAGELWVSEVILHAERRSRWKSASIRVRRDLMEFPAVLRNA